MKYLKKYWFLFLAAAITIFGIITGWYLFIFLVFPLGLFGFNKNEK